MTLEDTFQKCTRASQGTNSSAQQQSHFKTKADILSHPMCKLKEQTVNILQSFPTSATAGKGQKDLLQQLQKLNEQPPQAHNLQQHLSSYVKANILICKAITAKESVPAGYGQGNVARQIIPQGNVAFHEHYFTQS